MGTRGAYGLRLDGKDYITYNHFDSYPSGLGGDILEAARKLAKRSPKNLAKQVGAIKMVDEQTPAPPEAVEALEHYADLSVGSQKSTDWYCLLRNAQGNLLAHVDAGYMINSAGFVKDSLWCEWAYVVNLDDRTLECYRGFNENPQAKGRYAALKRDEPYNSEKQYYGVALMARFKLDELPTRKEFLKALGEED